MSPIKTGVDADMTMFEPLARAFVASVPERPRDDGLFGPRSVVWRVHRDRGFRLAGIRSLMVQALHPLAMAGVAEHSDWRRDPYGRLAATTGYVQMVTFGETAAAHAAAARVRAIHTQVNGVDAVTGLPYRADDPELLLWVHMAMVESILAVVQRYGRTLGDVDADRYVAEMVPFAEIVGVPAAMVPVTVAGLKEAIESIDILQVTPAAREAMAVVLDPPDLDAEARELWAEMGQIAIGTLPEWARDMYGFPPPPDELLEREAVRQLLGALDFAFESQPGVLEARRRIELRMRG